MARQEATVKALLLDLSGAEAYPMDGRLDWLLSADKGTAQESCI